MERKSGGTITALAVALAALAIAGFTAPAAGGHGAEFGNYTVNLPHPSDHYPRGVNGYNASINHFSAGTPESFAEAGAPKGVEKLEFIIIQNQDVDFSECSSENTAAYGIDRGNNRSGTQTDVSLLNYMEGSTFNDHSIVVDHYEGDELAAPDDAPINVMPEDEIVSHQGHQSQGGACYGMPEDPGWYQIHGFLNGTAYNGNHVEINVPSHYFYICECDSEQEARNKIGPPPSEQDGDATPTPTPAPDSDAGDDPTPTPTRTAADENSGGDGGGGGGGGGGGDGGTDQSSGGGDGGSQQADDSGGQATASPTPARNGGGGGQSQATARTTEAIPTTPTIASGPGFGALLSLLALLAAALVAVRRR